MKRKIAYGVLVLLFMIGLLGYAGVYWFNNMWFKEKPVYMTYTLDSGPIDFKWSENIYEDHIEPHAALLVPVSIDGHFHKYYLQLDTGAPHTMIYGNILATLSSMGLSTDDLFINDQRFIESLEIKLGKVKVRMQQVPIMENYGKTFDKKDTSAHIIIGTLGSDFIHDRITSIDFKNQLIQVHQERPDWMQALTGFESFDFKGRRLMLPAMIDGNEMELFYDSGCSSFGLITSKNRFEKYTQANSKVINYKAGRFGESFPIYHKETETRINMGSADLALTRISYVDMYGDYQKFMAPFSRIQGWLGNKPFVESTLILDTRAEEFIVIKN